MQAPLKITPFTTKATQISPLSKQKTPNARIIVLLSNYTARLFLYIMDLAQTCDSKFECDVIDNYQYNYKIVALTTEQCAKKLSRISQSKQ